MACLTELKCAIYADGELAEEEAREVTRHVASCGACRQLVASLRFERSILVDCLQDIEMIEFELEDDVLSSPQAASLTLTKFAAFVMAMAVLLRPVFTALGEFQLPLSASAQFDLIVDFVMYGIPAVMNSISVFINIASLVVVAMLACIGLFILFRKSPVISTLVSVLTLVTVFSPWTYAIDVRRGEKPVSVPAGETIDDTLVVMGESAVDIEGTVNGDLIALARDVRVKGTVKGNVVSFAERTEIDGTVEGSILGTGGLVEVRGNVARNLYGLAGSVAISEGAHIDGNASMFVGEATLDGSVGKDFNAYSARATGWGPFQRSMFSHGAVIQILSHARVGRNVYAKVAESESAIVDPAAAIKGQKSIAVTPVPPSRYTTASFYVRQTIWMAAAFVFGLGLLWAVPGLGRFQVGSGQDLLVTGGIGLAAAVVPPVAALLISLTLVGLPLGLLTAAVWIAALYTSKIVIAAFLGRSLLQNRGLSESSMPVTLLAGLVLVFFSVNLPYVGGVINFLLVILGLGGVAMTSYRLAQERNPSSSVTALTA
ncbi:MAG TPA: zf-HC2 domain-containing protein [Terriglobia bacterium]|nr:zf-HC2 domain-containing protein [Terriglobia bacterium]